MSTLLFGCRQSFASGFVFDVQFEVAAHVIGLVGPSGSGKSTTLAMIAGILRPQQGLVRLGNHVLDDTTQGVHLSPERRQIGCVFQDLRLFPHLTVDKNLRFGMVRRPVRRLVFERVVEVLELSELLDRFPRTLSGGQQQRTALGRALLRGPELLLLDEPLSALDSDLKSRIGSYVERVIQEWSIPTILVSHDESEVRRIADSIVVLNAGRVTRVESTTGDQHDAPSWAP